MTRPAKRDGGGRGVSTPPPRPRRRPGPQALDSQGLRISRFGPRANRRVAWRCRQSAKHAPGAGACEAARPMRPGAETGPTSAVEGAPARDRRRAGGALYPEADGPALRAPMRPGRGGVRASFLPGGRLRAASRPGVGARNPPTSAGFPRLPVRAERRSRPHGRRQGPCGRR